MEGFEVFVSEHDDDVVPDLAARANDAIRYGLPHPRRRKIQPTGEFARAHDLGVIAGFSDADAPA